MAVSLDLLCSFELLKVIDWRFRAFSIWAGTDKERSTSHSTASNVKRISLAVDVATSELHVPPSGYNLVTKLIPLLV